MKNIIITIVVVLVAFASANAQTTEFTYQGKLFDNSLPPTANYDFQFKLYDALANGNQLPVGSPVTVTKTNVAVASGIFTVTLDFGNQFTGPNRFLDISVRTAGGGAYTPLTPRQPITSSPYAEKSLNAATADTATNSTQLGGVAANQFVVTTDPRMTDARTPTANSADYVQNNPAGQQPLSSFNISGDGTAGGTLTGNIVNAVTQYNIGGSRVLSVSGISNTFAGINA